MVFSELPSRASVNDVFVCVMDHRTLSWIAAYYARKFIDSSNQPVALVNVNPTNTGPMRILYPRRRSEIPGTFYTPF